MKLPVGRQQATGSTHKGAAEFAHQGTGLNLLWEFLTFCLSWAVGATPVGSFPLQLLLFCMGSG